MEHERSSQHGEHDLPAETPVAFTPRDAAKALIHPTVARGDLIG